MSMLNIRLYFDIVKIHEFNIILKIQENFIFQTGGGGKFSCMYGYGISRKKNLAQRLQIMHAEP